MNNSHINNGFNNRRLASLEYPLRSFAEASRSLSAVGKLFTSEKGKIDSRGAVDGEGLGASKGGFTFLISQTMPYSQTAICFPL